MCGVAGIVHHAGASAVLYEVLTVLQHRGQNSAGMATCHQNRLYLRKVNGLVRDAFHPKHLMRLQGNVGIGHVRYPTAGSLEAVEAQPFYVNSPYGIALAHNGNLTNACELRENLSSSGRHLNTQSDSEILLNVLAEELQHHRGHLTLSAIDQAVQGVHRRCKGGYAAVAVISGYGLLAFRDSWGIRPLILGRCKAAQGMEYLVASESVALDCVGFEVVRDVAPGETIFIDIQGQLHTIPCMKPTQLSPCLFEYVYMARPDSVIDKISVYAARVKMGQTLAKKVRNELDLSKVDVVMPIPESSRAAALELARCLGIPYREGFVKNHYIGRTFIMSGQSTRRHSVRRKLNAMRSEFVDKNVLLVDDSIVRGTTCRQLVEMAREAGAKKVYFCSAAPTVRYPNVYGIDMPVAHELVAHGRTTQEICDSIGADALIYQDLDAMIKTLKALNPAIKHFECAVFDGHYLTGDVNSDYLEELAKIRADDVQNNQPAALVWDCNEIVL